MPKSAQTTEVYNDLRSRLMNGGFAAGEKLKPQELQQRYYCSANTVRDVLFRLSRIGLVVFEEQKGFRTRMISAEARRDVTQFRILLEQEGIVRSMYNGGVAWEAQLSAVHHKLSHIETRIARSGEPGDDGLLWSQAEWEFHNTLVSACGSPILIETFETTYSRFRQQMHAQERDFGEDYFKAVIQEHQAIMDAALARDEDACRRAVYDHLKRNF